MRTCSHCGTPRDEADFPRNKNHQDGSGLSSYCSLCCEDPDVFRSAQNERNYDSKYRDPEVRAALESHRLTRERKMAEKAELARHLAARAAGQGDPIYCKVCGTTKMAHLFPRDINGLTGTGHSSRCFDCWHAMPDWRAELARERARSASKAQKGRDVDAEREQWRRDRAVLVYDAAKYGFTYRAWKALPEGEKCRYIAGLVSKKETLDG